ncbi:hypothetical protein NPX93_29855, partial [Bacillus mycoides]|uniref:hypothetical protein n=1 Tax=Bacillus mycoides TaxID=1405 RepID=UPI002112014B
HLTYNAAAAGISGPDAAAALEANIDDAIESADLAWRSLHRNEYLYTTRQRLEEQQYVRSPAGPGWCRHLVRPAWTFA